MFTLSFNSSAFFFASAMIVSAPARFSWMRFRVTSSVGFVSSVGAGRTERHRARTATKPQERKEIMASSLRESFGQPVMIGPAHRVGHHRHVAGGVRVALPLNDVP